MKGLKTVVFWLGLVVLGLPGLAWSQTYALALNTVADGQSVPDNSSLQTTVAPNALVPVAITPVLSITGGTAPPNPNDVNLSVVYDTNLTLDTVALASDPNWGCDTSVLGQIGCSLTSPPPNWPNVPQLPLSFTAPASGGPYNININGTPVFYNTPPGNINTTTADVGVQVAASTADMEVTMTLAQNPIAVSDYEILTVDWRNNGPDLATNAQVQVNLPAGSAFITPQVSGNPWNCTVTGTVVSCTQASIPVNTFGQFDISFDAPASVGSYPVTASIGAIESDPVTSNDSASATLVTQPVVTDASVTTTVNVNQAVPGDTVQFIARVINEGNQYVDGYLEFSTTPSQSLVGYSAPTGWNCLQGNTGVIACSSGGQIAPVAGGVEPASRGIGGINVGFDETFMLDIRINPAETAASITGTAVLKPIYSPPLDDNTANDSSSAFVQLGTPEADLSVDKTAVYTPPLQNGDTYEYRIKVTNQGPQPAPGVLINDQLPDNVELLSVDAPFGWTCLPSSGMGVMMQCDFNRALSPPDSQTIVQHVRYLGGEMVQTSASVTADVDDPAMGNNRVERIDNVITGPQVDLVLSQTVSETQVVPGGVISVTYVVQNAGQADANGVSLDINHGSLLMLMAKAGPDWSCSAQGTNQTVCLLNQPLAAGSSQSLNLDFQVAETDGVVDLLATVSSQEPDLQSGDNSQQTRITIGQGGGSGEPFDLQLGLTSTTSTPLAGQQFSIAAVLDNLGPGAAAGFVVDFTLPNGLALLQASGEGWQCSPLNKAPNLQCVFNGVLSNGGQTQVQLDVEATGQPGQSLLLDAVTYVPNGSEQNASNSMASLALQISASDFATQAVVTGSADKTQVRSGETIQYAFEVTNEGAVPIQSAYVEAMLDGPASFAVETAKQWACTTVEAKVLRCNLEGEIPPGATETVQFAAKAEVSRTPGVIQLLAALVDANDPANISEQLVVDVSYLGLSDVDLRRLLDDAAGGDEIAGGSVGPIEEMCLTPANDTEQAFCDALFQALDEGRLSDVRNVLRAVNPRAVITQTSAMVEVSAAQFRNIDARMNQLRSGAGGFSMNGLNLRYGDQTLQLTSLRYLMNDVDSARESGLARPWGFFVNGTISVGDRDPTTREIAFDFSSSGITAGMDYRFSHNLVLGAALGYASFGSDDADGGSMDTRGTTLTGYLSWYPKENWFVDARISQGWLNVDQKRSVEFSIGPVSQDVLMAGSTDATQTTLALATGMHFNHEGLVMTPNLSMRYMGTSVGGYDERAAGIGAVSYSAFDFDSLVLSAGLQMNKSISLDSGVLTPQLDANFRYETQNDGMIIEARLLGRQSPFLVRTDSPDRGYGTLGGGLVYVTNGGKQFYFTYRQLLGLEGFSQYTVNLGLRMEF